MQAPELVDITIHKEEIEVPGLIEVEVRGTDDIAGLESGRLYFENKVTNKTISVGVNGRGEWNNKFTDKQLQELLDKPELLEKLGINQKMLSGHIVLKPVENATFTDVPETHWASGFVKLAAELGLVVGMPDATFEPSASLQVGDTFTFLDRVLLLNGITEMKLPRSTVEKYITNKEHWAFANAASIGSKLSEDTLKTVSQLGAQPITRGLLTQVLYEITGGKLNETRESVIFTDTQTLALSFVFTKSRYSNHFKQELLEALDGATVKHVGKLFKTPYTLAERFIKETLKLMCFCNKIAIESLLCK